MRLARVLSAVVSVSIALALTYDLTLQVPGSLTSTFLGVLSFLFGVIIGSLADILLPTSGLAAILSIRGIRVATSQYPVRWEDVNGQSSLPSSLAYAVIIPCHNYGDYLRDAITSVLSQTLPASEIVVVLDSCTDNSGSVAEEFAHRGVRTIIVNCADPYLARRAGFYATSAPLVCCLDADDYVGESYFASGTRCFVDPLVGIATGWVQHVGARNSTWQPLPGDIEKVNCVSSAGIFRRSAALGIRAFEKMELAGVFEEDYLFWKLIARAGWEVAVFKGTHFHRRHASNRSITTPTGVAWALSLRRGKTPPNDTIRVGYVGSTLLPAGGVETLLRQLQRHAFRIEWTGIAHAPEKPEQRLQEQVYMGIPILENSIFDEAVRELAARSDVLYAWQNTDLPRLATLGLDIPIWGCVHGAGSYSAAVAQQLSLMPSAHVVAVSEAARSVCPSPAQVIYNGADLQALSEGPTRWAQRDVWEIRQDEVAVGYLGRWSPEKRVHLLLSAFALLPNHVRPVLCVAEPLPPPEERRSAEDIAGRPIVWTTTTTPGAAYRALDMVVMTSFTEGCQLVALEAWACGCPLITTPVGIVPEITKSHGDLAYVLPMNPTSKEIATAIVETLEDKVLTVERRQRAKDVVWNHFTVWRTARAWERGLAELVRESKKRERAAEELASRSSVTE